MSALTPCPAECIRSPGRRTKSLWVKNISWVREVTTPVRCLWMILLWVSPSSSGDVICLPRSFLWWPSVLLCGATPSRPPLSVHLSAACHHCASLESALVQPKCPHSCLFIRQGAQTLAILFCIPPARSVCQYLEKSVRLVMVFWW